MEINRYRIAGLDLQMTIGGEIMRRQGRAYRFDFTGEPLFEIAPSQERLEMLAAENPHLSLDECEYIETGSIFYARLLHYDGFFIHSSAVALDGKAYLFSGPCGVGKSTHTRLWRGEFGDAAEIINDDKPAIRYLDGRFDVFGTPWSGKSRRNRNVRVPLDGLALLSQARENKIERVSDPEAIYFILNQTVRPCGKETAERLLTLLDRFFRSVPVWRLECAPNLEAVRLSHGAMSAISQKTTEQTPSEKKNED